MKAIISGGGTGGHIFPAISIAEELKRVCPDVEIQFVGAEGRMEMEKVPAAGYDIIGLPISGFQRKLSLQNFKTIMNIFKSSSKAKRIIKDFKPDIAIGVGGYASYPVLKAAQSLGVPTLIQEQNSYAGVTNKVLAKKVNKVCVAYDGMEKFFRKETIVFTGNPIRPQIQNISCTKEESLAEFNLDANKPTILVVGGSLGARTVNQSVAASLEVLKENGIQVLWQTGKTYYQTAVEQAKGYDNIKVHEFIYTMDKAFTAADIIVSRAGASSISELCLIGKACIFVPSPNVSEDHQTKNAMALVNKGAAKIIKDSEAVEKLFPAAIELLNNKEEIADLSKNIKALGIPNAAELIGKEILELVKK